MRKFGIVMNRENPRTYVLISNDEESALRTLKRDDVISIEDLGEYDDRSLPQKQSLRVQLLRWYRTMVSSDH